MKTEEVPQDRNSLFDGHTKAMYARGESGRYTTVESSGWRVEEIATDVALADFQELARAAYEQCRTGRCAPLAYHMYSRRMDSATLADCAGMAHWRVRRHLRPAVFARLPPRLLARYAQALQLPVSTLTSLPDTADADQP